MATSSIKLKKGLDIPLEGAPQLLVAKSSPPDRVEFVAADFEFARPRTAVTEGQQIRRGDVLFYDRKNDALKFRSPVAGTVREIVWGPRRTLEKIVVTPTADETPADTLNRFTPAHISRLTADEVVRHLCDTGALALIDQRPFAVRAEPTARPKSIFVNGMNTAPFSPDIRMLVAGEETFYQAGLDALAQIAPGRVFQCLDGRIENFPTFVKQPANTRVFYFSGPHPAGLSSVHIHYLDPIKHGDVVWTLSAAAVVQIGHAFLEGTLPATRVVSLGGPAVRGEARQYYRVHLGERIGRFIEGKVLDGEVRHIAGDVLSGRASGADTPVRLRDFGFTVLKEGRERRYLGWIMPGLDQFSRSPSFVSWWFRRGRSWALDTNMHGSRRAMVLTGLYDRYVPMNIMTDFLIRAILARDYEEAIRLGLLEVAPEDFALPAFVCPSKMDLVGIVRQGLKTAREEGF